MTLVHEIFHAVIGLYRKKNVKSIEALRERLGGVSRDTVLAFLHTFPTPAIYKHLQGEGEETPEKLLDRGGQVVTDEYHRRGDPPLAHQPEPGLRAGAPPS